MLFNTLGTNCSKMGIMVGEMGMALLEIEGKAEEILEVHPL